jgi:hypothetical protein
MGHLSRPVRRCSEKRQFGTETASSRCSTHYPDRFESLPAPSRIVIDQRFNLLRNLMTIVSSAGIDDPSSWKLCRTTGKIVTRTEELIPGGSDQL